MDHDDAIRLKAVEAYLLGDLSEEMKEEFEEHYFACRECAIDVQMGTAFVEGSKVLLSQQPGSQAAAAPKSKLWLSWLRPAFTVPVMALLLVVIGYQAMIHRSHGPGMASNTAATAIYLPAGVSRGVNEAVPVKPNSPFAVQFDIPWQQRFSSYTYELHSPSGELLWSVTVPSEVAKNTVSVATYVTAAGSGDYTLQGRGVDAAGQTQEFSPQVFRLEIQ